jgi:hypothetical protein
MKETGRFNQDMLGSFGIYVWFYDRGLLISNQLGVCDGFVSKQLDGVTKTNRHWIYDDLPGATLGYCWARFSCPCFMDNWPIWDTLRNEFICKMWQFQYHQGINHPQYDNGLSKSSPNGRFMVFGIPNYTMDKSVCCLAFESPIAEIC